MRCDLCGKKFHVDFPEFVWNDWLKLSHFIEFLRAEDQITEATAEIMGSALMSFRPEVECNPKVE